MDQSLTGIGLKQNPIERKIKKIQKNVSFEVNGLCRKRDGQWCVYEANSFFTNFGTVLTETLIFHKKQFYQNTRLIFCSTFKNKKKEKNFKAIN